MIIISTDDGTVEDEIIWTTLDKYKLKGVFYIPNSTDLTKQQIKELSKRHIIGGHTVNHPSDMKILNDVQLKFEIEHNKRWLEELTGKKLTKFCYPRGRHNERVRKAVKDAGYKEARTTNVLSTEYPKDKFQTDTTVHWSYPRKEYAGKDWFDLANDFLEGVVKQGGRFEMWGHSREAIRTKSLDKFDAMCKIISSMI